MEVKPKIVKAEPTINLMKIVERGWTRKMVDEFLKPIQHIKNSHGCLMHIYLLSDVEVAECSPEFKKRLKTKQLRAANGKSYVDKRIGEIADHIDSLKFDLPEVNARTVTIQAFKRKKKDVRLAKIDVLVEMIPALSEVLDAVKNNDALPIYYAARNYVGQKLKENYPWI